MRLTPLGSREIIVVTAVCCVAALVLYNLYRFYNAWWCLLPIPLLALLIGWVLWFFRDPPRSVPTGPGLVVSPADGTVTHLDLVDEPDFIGGKALRCSIFLSVFDVHLNRAPAAGTVEFMKFRPGAFFDARREESLVKNQNQDVGLRVDEPGLPAKMLVRQSSGAIARRIVCPLRTGLRLERGVRYGMIKFGSRTTLFMSTDAPVEWRVKVGDKVKAGETVLAASVSAGGAGKKP